MKSSPGFCFGSASFWGNCLSSFCTSCWKGPCFNNLGGCNCQSDMADRSQPRAQRSDPPGRSTALFFEMSPRQSFLGRSSPVKTRTDAATQPEQGGKCLFGTLSAQHEAHILRSSLHVKHAIWSLLCQAASSTKATFSQLNDWIVLRRCCLHPSFACRPRRQLQVSFLHIFPTYSYCPTPPPPPSSMRSYSVFESI